jgi:plastocyanin
MRTLLVCSLFALASCGGGDKTQDLSQPPLVDLSMMGTEPDLSAVVDGGIDQGVPDLGPPDLAGVDFGPPVGSVQVTAESSTTLVLGGAHVQLDAVATDFDGGVLPNDFFFWHSDSPGVATVSASGLVTATGDGTAVIHAVAGPNMADGTITITVSIPVNTITVAPSPLIVADGKSKKAAATPHDVNGVSFNGVSFSWASAGSPDVIVDAMGNVTGSLGGQLGLGPISVTASAEGHQGSTAVSVAVYPTWNFTNGESGSFTVDVDQNQYLIFKNTDANTHSIVLDSGNTTLVNGWSNGDSASVQATLAPGTYTFHCGVHPTKMFGKLIVH